MLRTCHIHSWGKLLCKALSWRDEVLNKECKEVTKMTIRTKVLINDMLDTMYEAMGVGLAAPQVGILKRIVVIDIGEGPIILINPEIIETSGEQTGEEGCLSLPGKVAVVKRPDHVICGNTSYGRSNLRRRRTSCKSILS